MSISRLNEGNLSEESKKALQSETWQKARAALTDEVPDVNYNDIKSVKDSAVKMLKSELDKAGDKSFAEPIISYLVKRCEEDSGLAEDIIQEHKTWEKCFDYIYSEARKQAKGNRTVVRDNVVYEWAEDYYHRDDKAAEEEKAKKSAETKKKAEMINDKAKEKSGNATYKNSKNSTQYKENHIVAVEKKEAHAEKKEEPKLKKNSRDLDGQIDIFSMMGI